MYAFFPVLLPTEPAQTPAVVLHGPDSYYSYSYCYSYLMFLYPGCRKEAKVIFLSSTYAELVDREAIGKQEELMEGPLRRVLIPTCLTNFLNNRSTQKDFRVTFSLI